MAFLPKKFLILLTALLALTASASPRTTFSDGSLPINAGEVDPSFNVTSQPNGKINDILPLPDGRIIVGGDFTKCGEIDQAYLAMFEPDGSLITSFSPLLDGRVNAIALNEDSHSNIFPENSLSVGGAFNTVNGVVQRGFAILNPDGSSFEFGLSPGFNGEVHALIGPSGLNTQGIAIGGAFSTFNGDPAQNFIMMHLDYRWGNKKPWIKDGEVDGPVYAIEDHDPSGLFRYGFFIGGQFTKIREHTFSNLAFVDTLGEPYEYEPTFLELDGPVREIVLTESGITSLAIRGEFTNYGDHTAPGFAFLYSNQNEWNLLTTPLPASKVTSLARESQAQIRLGHLDGSISHLCGSRKHNQMPTWSISNNFGNNGPATLSAVTSSQADEFSGSRTNYNSFHGSATGELVKVRGLHGSTPPPAPNPELVTRNDQMLPILPLGLSVLEQQCDISSNNGQSWQALDPSKAFLLQGLFPNHPYQLRARYRNSNGFSQYSETVNFTSPIVTQNPGSLVPVGLGGDLHPTSPYSVMSIQPAANDGILLHTYFSGSYCGVKKDSTLGFALYDSDLRLLEFKEDLHSFYKNGVLSPPLVNGGYYYRDTSVHDSYRIIKLNPDLTDDESFSPIPIQSDSAGIYLLGPDDNLIVSDITSGDLPLLKIGKFDNDGSSLSTPLEIEIHSPLIEHLAPLPSGELLISGWFQNIPGHLEQTFRRISVSTAGVITPLSFPSPEDHVSQEILRPVAADGSQFVAEYFSPTEDPEKVYIRLRKTNAHGEHDSSFSATVVEKRYSFSFISGIKIVADGKLIVTGQFSHCNGVVSPELVRLNSDGSLDETFTPYLDRNQGRYTNHPDGSGLVEQSDGSIIYQNVFDNDLGSVIKLRGDTAPHNYDLWATAHGFTTFEPNADPDGDGLSQEIELLYGLNPHQPDDFNPLTITSENGSPVVKITPPTFPLSLPQFQSSPNLIDWDPAPLQPDFTLETENSTGFFKLAPSE